MSETGAVLFAIFFFIFAVFCFVTKNTNGLIFNMGMFLFNALIVEIRHNKCC